MRSDISGVPWHLCISESPASQQRAPTLITDEPHPQQERFSTCLPPIRASRVLLTLKNLPANAGDVVSIPGVGTSSGGGHATHFSILAWRIPWTEEHIGSKRVVHDCSDLACMHMPYQMNQLWPLQSSAGRFPSPAGPRTIQTSQPHPSAGSRNTSPFLLLWTCSAPHGWFSLLPSASRRSPAWVTVSSSGGSRCV